MRQFTIPENGIRVLLWPWNATSAAISIGIQSGSRDDPPETIDGMFMLYGLNHGYEHVMARATRRWPSWEKLVNRADETCFYFNAMTDKRAIILCAETDRQNVSTNLGFLYEMVAHPLITRENVEIERQRIRNEAREDLDNPSTRANNALDEVMFPNDGLAHPILGTEKTIARFTVQAMRNFHRRVVVGRRLVIAVTGNFDPERTEADIRRIFRHIRGGQPARQHGLNYRQLSGGIRFINNERLDQQYCLIGFPVFGLNDPRRPVISLLRNHFSHTQRGGSRIRLQVSGQGLGYSATDFLWHWSDVGEYHLEITVMPSQLDEMLGKVRDEIGLLRSVLIPEDQFRRSIKNAGYGAKAKFSSPLEAANFLADFTMTAGAFVPLRTFLQRIRRVTRTSIRNVARDIFVRSRMCVVIHGPTHRLRKTHIRQLLHWPR